jgi:hypothetical protein
MKPDLLTHVIVRQDGLETVVVIVHGAAAGLAKTRAHVFADRVVPRQPADARRHEPRGQAERSSMSSPRRAWLQL